MAAGATRQAPRTSSMAAVSDRGATPTRLPLPGACRSVSSTDARRGRRVHVQRRDREDPERRAREPAPDGARRSSRRTGRTKFWPQYASMAASASQRLAVIFVRGTRPVSTSTRRVVSITPALSCSISRSIARRAGRLTRAASVCAIATPSSSVLEPARASARATNRSRALLLPMGLPSRRAP
jgi:hypothetical protein